MNRLPPIDPNNLSDAQRPVYERIANGPRKGVRGPLAIWLQRPELAECAQALGRYCRYDTCLDPRLSELAILMMGRHWLAEYEWAAHKPFALEAGTVQLSGSIGIAMHEPGSSEQADTLLCRADAAMYEAKKGGKSRFALALPA